MKFGKPRLLLWEAESKHIVMECAGLSHMFLVSFFFTFFTSECKCVLIVLRGGLLSALT